MQEDDKTKFIESAPPILAKIKRGEGREREKFFTENFVIGRQSECDLQMTKGNAKGYAFWAASDGSAWTIFSF